MVTATGIRRANSFQSQFITKRTHYWIPDPQIAPVRSIRLHLSRNTIFGPDFAAIPLFASSGTLLSGASARNSKHTGQGSSTLERHLAVAPTSKRTEPAPKLPSAYGHTSQAHTHPAAAPALKLTSAHSSDTLQRHQHPSSQAHTAATPSSVRLENAHAALPILEVRTPIAHAIWEKQNYIYICIHSAII